MRFKKMENIHELIGKKIYVILKTGRKYEGFVNSIDNNIVNLTDKFHELVLFNMSEISSLEVEK